ncbi:MAG: hypothetical protein U0401_02910 [Anaerolineae bacterium]
MQFMLHGQRYRPIPLQTFRLQQNLPDDFSVAYFEPKDWTGLGSINGCGQLLAGMRQNVLKAMPPTTKLPELFPLVEALTDLFHQELVTINPHIGLKEVEIEFAVAGLADILRGVAFKLIQLCQTYRSDLSQVQRNFDFEAVYQGWLDDSTRLSSVTHPYHHDDATYQVQIVYNPYGRVGLKAQINGEIYYVGDMSLACPAASYMHELCGEIAAKMCEALNVER